MVELFNSNRSRFIDRLPDRTVAFLFAGEQAQMSQDDIAALLAAMNDDEPSPQEAGSSTEEATGEIPGEELPPLFAAIFI